METFRWVGLGMGAVVMGGVTYTMIGHENIAGACVMLGMFAATAWFILSDLGTDSYPS